MTTLLEVAPASVLIAWLIVAAVALPVAAQPVRVVGEGVMAAVPYVIEMDVQNQRFHVKTVEVGPLDPEFSRAALPSRIPIVTIFPDGSRRDGFYIYNRFGVPAHSFPYERVTSVVFDGKGYRVFTSPASSGSFQVDGAYNTPSGEMIPAGWTHHSRYYSTAPVRYSRDGAPDANARGNWDIVYQLPDPLPPGVPADDMDRIVTSVRDRFRRVLRDADNNRGQVRIKVLFEAPAGGGVAATDATRTVRQLHAIANGFSFQFDADMEQDAAAIAENIPNGATVPVLWNTVDLRQIGSVESPRAIEPQLGLPQGEADEEAVIRINPKSSFDFDAADGIDEDKIDFEYVLTHETVHALGFLSLVDDGQFSRT